MTSSPNFAYQRPVADIGGSLARAIFGDPQMAARQREQQAIADERAAQAQEARAHAGLYTSQTTGQDGQNTASHGLPDKARQWVAANAPAPPPPTVSSPEFANFDQPIPEPAARPDRGESLANMVAAMAQMNGEHVDPTKIVGSLASFMGGDELARRGLIAQGHNPTADFAVTPERADQVAGIKNDALEQRALGVANIGAGARRYAADSSAGASRYGADSRARTSNFATSTRAATSREVADARAAAARDRAAAKATDQLAARRARPISVSSFKKLDTVVAQQLDAHGLQSLPADDGTPGATRLNPGVNTWIRTRAIENFRQSGNFLDAAAKAIGAAVAASDRQKAARAARGHSSAGQARASTGTRLTVQEAANLPRGTRFVGVDGVTRERQ